MRTSTWTTATTALLFSASTRGLEIQPFGNQGCRDPDAQAFSRGGLPDRSAVQDRVYGHYKEGQEKLPAAFNLDFLKKNFLIYKQEKITHEVHTELELVTAQLASFRSRLEINLWRAIV